MSSSTDFTVERSEGSGTQGKKLPGLRLNVEKWILFKGSSSFRNPLCLLLVLHTIRRAQYLSYYTPSNEHGNQLGPVRHGGERYALVQSKLRRYSQNNAWRCWRRTRSFLISLKNRGIFCSLLWRGGLLNPNKWFIYKYALHGFTQRSHSQGSAADEFYIIEEGQCGIYAKYVAVWIAYLLHLGLVVIRKNFSW